MAASLIAAGAASHSGGSVPGPFELRGGWQFRLDPADQGLASGWERPDVPFAAQQTLATGISLADQGTPAYRGTAWYRQWVTVPQAWSRVVIGFGGVDVACDLYVNGRFIGHFDDSLGERAAHADVTDAFVRGEPALLVLRLTASGGFGGIKQVARLGQDESEVMTGLQYVVFLHDEHPAWRLADWMNGGRRAWTVSGVEQAEPKAVVAVDGTVSPSAGSFGINFWLYDRTAGKLVDFKAPSAALRDGSSPIPIFEFQEGTWRLREEVAGYGPPQRPAAAMRLTLDRAPNDAWLYVALRPYTASGGFARITSAEARDRKVWLNGQIALQVLAGGNVTGGALNDTDVSTIAARGDMPRQVKAGDRRGNAQALLRLAVREGESLLFASPSQPGQSLPAGIPDMAGLSSDWQRRLRAIQLDLPDTQLEDAFYASLGYLLVERRGRLIHPGPLLHDAFWVRDAAMIGYALQRSGLSDAVAGSADALYAAIRSDGGVTAVTTSGGQARPNVELDAAGEAAFGIVEQGRYSGDLARLRSRYPALIKALRYAFDHRDGLGLVPPNESAEDIGPATAHHYWDDLWLLTGLKDAAWAARLLGQAGDEAWLTAAFDELQRALVTSIATTGSPIIPGGPEDLETPAMARGATPALWPLPVLDPGLPLVRDSFQAYFQRFVEPNGGAYRHVYGQWWPYGGLEIAHALLFLNEREKANQILDFTLSHQTAPGLFAWAEGVDPSSGGFAEGDMPHGWAAAEVVNLVRDMLFYEDGDTLVVGAGVPPGWRGKPFSIRQAPTTWGAVNVEIAGDGEVRVSGAQPPGGVDVRLPWPATLAAS